MYAVAAMTDDTDHLLLIHEVIEAAHANLSEPVWDYLVGGAESETTLRRNRQAIDAVALRPRVLRDVSNVDCSATLLGGRMRIPVLLAPIGSLQDLHPGGGATVATCARAQGFHHMGEFAAAYRATFHEAPSDTLARGLQTGFLTG